MPYIANIYIHLTSSILEYYSSILEVKVMPGKHFKDLWLVYFLKSKERESVIKLFTGFNHFYSLTSPTIFSYGENLPKEPSIQTFSNDFHTAPKIPNVVKPQHFSVNLLNTFNHVLSVVQHVKENKIWAFIHIHPSGGQI